MKNTCQTCDSHEGYRKGDFSNDDWYVVQAGALELGNDDFCICKNCLKKDLNELTIRYSKEKKEDFIKHFKKYLT